MVLAWAFRAVFAPSCSGVLCVLLTIQIKDVATLTTMHSIIMVATVPFGKYDVAGRPGVTALRSVAVALLLHRVTVVARTRRTFMLGAIRSFW